jgi:hypothetical protein
VGGQGMALTDVLTLMSVPKIQMLAALAPCVQIFLELLLVLVQKEKQDNLIKAALV